MSARPFAHAAKLSCTIKRRLKVCLVSKVEHGTACQRCCRWRQKSHVPKGLAVVYSLWSLLHLTAIAAGDGSTDSDAVSHDARPAQGSSTVSASRLSRLFFILGQVAIQHLVSCSH